MAVNCPLARAASVASSVRRAFSFRSSVPSKRGVWISSASRASASSRCPLVTPTPKTERSKSTSTSREAPMDSRRSRKRAEVMLFVPPSLSMLAVSSAAPGVP